METIAEIGVRRWLNRIQAADYLSLSKSQLDNLIRAGRIRVSRIGKRIIIDRFWLDEQLAAGGL